MTIEQWLIKHDACSEGFDFAASVGFDLWTEYQRADWLLWLAEEIEKDSPDPKLRRAIALAGCDCAETALKFIPAGEDRPRAAIQARRDFEDGKISRAELAAAADAAVDAAWDAAWTAARVAAWDAAWTAARVAAWAAAWVAAWVAARVAAWVAARAAAWAAARDAATDAATAAAWAAALRDMCPLVRARISIEDIRVGLEKVTQ